MTLTNLQKLALTACTEFDRSAIGPGTYVIEPFNVTVGGRVTVCADEEYTPTIKIPLIPTVALALKKMGIQREHFLKVMKEAVVEVLAQDADMRAALMQQSGLTTFEEEFRSKVLQNLPKSTRNGKVLTDVTVARTEE